MSVPNEAMTDAFRLAEQQNTMLRQMLADRAKRKANDLSMSMFVRREDLEAERRRLMVDEALCEIARIADELLTDETARIIRSALFKAREAASTHCTAETV